MAYLPLVDTMHHVLKAWCIFYWFHFDSPGRWGQKGQNAECSPRSLLSAVPEAFCRQIISGMDALIDEETLLAYIASHGHNLEKKNVAARKNVSKLIEKAKDTAESETKLIELRRQAESVNKSKKLLYAEAREIEHFRNTDAQSLNHLYEVVTGQSVHGGKGTKTLFKNACLPREIKSRFPEAVTLSKKDPTYEELRKLIILLASYNFWYQLQDKNADIEDYIEEMNGYLDESGFPLMYYGNPYDWLFLYCTLADNPLETFRGILAEVLDEE